MNCCELWQTSTSKHSEHTATSIRKSIVTTSPTLTLFTPSLLCWLQLDGRAELSHSQLSLLPVIYRNVKKNKINKEGNHTSYTYSAPNQKQLRKTSEKNCAQHLGSFMGGPRRNRENRWKARCQIWWYCWIFSNSYFLGTGYSPHRYIIFIEP